MLALPLSSWVGLAAVAMRGPMLMPGEAGWEAWVQSSGFQTWLAASLNAAVWLCFGIIALHATLREIPAKPRFFGAALLLAGTTVFLPVLGLMWSWPSAPVEAATGAYQQSMVVTWLGFAVATSMLGLLVLAWGLRRSDPWSAIGLAVAVAAYVPVHWAELVGGAALALAFTRLTWRVWAGQAAATPPG